MGFTWISLDFTEDFDWISPRIFIGISLRISPKISSQISPELPSGFPLGFQWDFPGFHRGFHWDFTQDFYRDFIKHFTEDFTVDFTEDFIVDFTEIAQWISPTISMGFHLISPRISMGFHQGFLSKFHPGFHRNCLVDFHQDFNGISEWNETFRACRTCTCKHNCGFEKNCKPCKGVQMGGIRQLPSQIGSYLAPLLQMREV